MKKALPIFFILLIISQLFLDILKVEAAPSFTSNSTIYYEAEEAEFITDRDNIDAINGEAVFLPYGNIDNNIPYCKFTIKIDADGYYNLAINSYGVGDIKYNVIELDGYSLNDNYLMSLKNEWSEYLFLEKQYLKKGEHTIMI